MKNIKLLALGYIGLCCFSCTNSPEIDLIQERKIPLDSLSFMIHVPEGVLHEFKMDEALPLPNAFTKVVKTLKKETGARKYIFSYPRAGNPRFGAFIQKTDTFYYLLEQPDSLWNQQLPLNVSHTEAGDFLLDPSLLNSTFDSESIRGNIQLDSNRLELKANLKPIHSFLQEYIQPTPYSSENPHITLGMTAALIREINNGGKITLPENDLVLFYEYLGTMLDSSVVVSTDFDEEFNVVESRQIQYDTLRQEQAIFEFGTTETATSWMDFFKNQGFVTGTQHDLTVIPNYKAAQKENKLYILPKNKTPQPLSTGKENFISVRLTEESLQNFPYESPYLEKVKMMQLDLHRDYNLHSRIFFSDSLK
jgi:hypothetical protein